MQLYMNMLTENDENVKLYALKKISKGDITENMLNFIYSLLNENTGFVKVRILTLLYKQKYKKVIDYALKNIDNEIDIYVRSIYVKCLGLDSEGMYVDTISKHLIHQDSRIRANAVIALGNIKKRSIIELIDPMINDSNPRVKLNAYYVLYDRIGEDVFSNFIKLSKDENKYVRAATAYTLSKIHSKKVFPLLMSLLRDSESVVRKNAVKALCVDKNITYLKYFINAFVKETERIVRIELVNAMKSIDTERSVDRLNTLADETQDKNFKIEVIKAYSIFNTDRCMNYIINKLSSKEADIRLAAIEALGKFKDRSIIDTLLPFLNDPENDIKIMSAKVLWKFGVVNAYTSLKKMVSQKDETVRKKAKYVLALMGL